MTPRRNWLQTALQVEPGEGRLVGLLVGLYFSLTTAVVLVQTMTFGLFLAEFGSSGLPYAYIAIAGLASLAAFLYLKLSERVAFLTLLNRTMIAMMAGCLVFWLGLQSPASRWFTFLLPAWFQTFINLANLIVWPLAGRLFDLRQGKRLFGLVGAGNWLANILAGLGVPVLVRLFGAPQLLGLAVPALVAAFGLVRVIARDFLNVARPAPPALAPIRAPRPAPRRWIDQYASLIFVYVALWWVAFFFVDNVFYSQAASQFPDAGALTAFIGQLLSVTGLVALVTSLLAAGRVLARYGLRAGLLTMPLVVTALMAAVAAGGQLGLAAVALFWLGTLGKLFNVAWGFSLSQSANAIIYQALPDDRRARIQTAAEGIIQPVAIGVSGVALLALTAGLRLGSSGVAAVFLLVAAGWILAIVWLAQQYPRALAQALGRRQLGATPLAPPDPASRRLLQQALANPHPGAALYALNLLEQFEPAALPPALLRLLDHPAPDVRRQALARLEWSGAADAAGLIQQRLEADPEPEVRAAALRALAAAGTDEAFGIVIAALDSPEAPIRHGALVGLLRHGGLDGVLAGGQTFNRLLASPAAADRILAAQVLGEAGVTHFFQPVLALLRDPDAGVRRAALGAAGQIRHPRLWPAVVAAAAAAETAPAAGAALVAGGEAALPAIEAAFAAAGAPRRQLMTLARAGRHLRGECATAWLQAHSAHPSAEVRTLVLEALAVNHYRAPEPASVQRQIEAEARLGAWTAEAMTDLGNLPATTLLGAALQADRRGAGTRVLLWLSCLYDSPVILSARAALARGLGQQAVALEVIDAHLPADLKALVMPLLEDLPAPQRTEARPGLPGRLSALITGPEAAWFSPWTRACALHLAGSWQFKDCAPAAAAAAADPEPLVRQVASWTLARLSAGGSQGDGRMLSTIEKVIILKTVDLFSQTPDDILAEVADLLETVPAAEDETIFEKGDLGDSLYIIVAGRVRVHDGERLLNYLGERDVFGEMALLDPEPRLASVTAEEPTLLFRLAQAPFYELLAERPEVAAGVIRVLTRHLRARVRDLAQLDARLKAVLGARP